MTERETLDNGAYIERRPEFDRHFIYDSEGRLRGMRPTLEAAKQLAASISPPSPPVLRRVASPTADELLPEEPRADERPPPTCKPPRVILRAPKQRRY
jgi:hypothetical protein